jgi:hypothetical protein
MNISIEKAASYLAPKKGITLSTHQIGLLMRTARNESHGLETDGLSALVESIQGLSFVQEVTDDGSTLCSGIRTFTLEELANLEADGDVVAIVPTFVPLNLNWPAIPLTVVGRSRDLRCAGLFRFGRTTSQTFSWILHVLWHRLPCPGKLVAIISDDDQALESASR